MRRAVPTLLALVLLAPLASRAQVPTELHASYDVYGAGLNVAQVEVASMIGPRAYKMRVAYHTTGLVGVFIHGQQRNTVEGVWNGDAPRPHQYEGIGFWHGEDHVTLIDYLNGQPLIRRLLPSQDTEREPVPVAMQQNTVDSLSALALLIRRVAETGRCESSVRTFDGHRASEVTSHTVGEDILAATGRSIFSGRALRCDFVGQMQAGFLLEDSSPHDRRPLHGSAWLARMVPGAPPVPVRLAFETHWVGDATMYLTHLEPATTTEIASH